MERDTRLTILETQYIKSQDMRPEEKMDTKSYKDNKLRIEWDIAWKVFESVNKQNDTT